jgi:hypothetical protein
MLKRFVLLASLCVAAAMMIPVASASATLTGKCTVKGLAKFGGAKLTSTNQTKLGYSFSSEEGQNPETVCVESGSNTVRKGSATVTGGKFEGSCTGAGKSETDGAGTLTLPGAPGSPFKFDLEFTSNNGKVSLAIENASETTTATGEANFAASVQEPAATCLTTGVKELEFVATTEGSIG